ncbi:MAG TPA: hypothetical protein VF611_17760 [Pyrinomonadaceae bacterium]|jgi:hypothetical protein
MNRTMVALCALALTLVPTRPAAGQGPATDLTMRRALYFTGAKTDKIDTRAAAKGGDLYVVENGRMTLKRSQATKCEAGGCYFNFGFIAFRNPAAGALSTYGLIEVEGGGLSGNTVHFADKAGTRQGVFPVKLADGVNKLTFRIDPYAKTQESDESNNGFSVTVVVQG